MDEREVAETMRGLGYEVSQTAHGSQAWIKRGSGECVYRPDRKVSRWYASYAGAGFVRRRQEFSCPVAAALWLAVEVA